MVSRSPTPCVGGGVYGHSREGLKLRIMREVDRMYNPANWQSVIAMGAVCELE